MINSIIELLKSKGTIPSVYHRDDFVKSPKAPYVMVWEDEIQNYDNKNGVAQVYISAHFEKGCIDNLTKYMNTELTDILHNGLATDGIDVVQLKSTLIISKTIYTNDDGTISRDRVFTYPLLGLI
jgi:hypothetical protein